MRAKVCGIYAIIHTASGKRYIGSSSSIRDRWHLHRWQLRRGEHHSTYLQRAWDKHGEEAFTFEIVEECLVDLLFEREQHYLDHYSSADPLKGYNTLVKPGSGLGYRHTDEAKRRMSESQRKISYEDRLKFCRSFVGRRHTEETKKKMSVASRGRIVSEETRAKIGAASKGRIPNAEARAKMSASRKGKSLPEKVRNKISQAHKGRTFTPEWRAKISAAAKQRTVSPETRAKIAETMRAVRARKRASQA